MQKGLSLIEFLIISAIFGIILGITIFALKNFQPDLELSGTVRNLVSDLRYAQELSVTEQVSYSIRFSTTTQEKYQLIKNNTPEEIVKEEILPSEIDFQHISELINNEIKFNSYGAVQEAGIIVLINNKGNTKTIRVGPSGFVRILD